MKITAQLHRAVGLATTTEPQAVNVDAQQQPGKLNEAESHLLDLPASPESNAAVASKPVAE